MSLNLNIVLVHPQIPNNTGNIGRTCVATNSKLHLIKPLGFEITDSRVKRSGLDYWPDLDLSIHESFENWLSTIENIERVFFFSSHGTRSFYDVQLQENDYLVFGKESDGLGLEILQQFQKQTVTIPFPGKVRSFNLANAVAMALGEGIRQSIL